MATAQDRPDGPDLPASMREIETKFDVPTSFQLPQLSPWTGSGGRVEVDTIELASTYYDTSEQRLLGFHLTVRRRSAVGNSTDVGWQLKTPGAGYRSEFHWPDDGSGQPPDALVELLAPFVGDHHVASAIRLEVTRTRHRLVTAAGDLIAEVAEDDVHAIALATPVRAPRWREVEVELGPEGDRSLLAKIGRALMKAGAQASPSRSKFARALAGIGNESAGSARASAGAVLTAYIATQVDVIVAGHFAIQGNAEDSVHQTRVAARRIRSTLRTFGASYDGDRARALDAELQWYASVLGAVRDLEVLRRRLAAAIADLPSDVVCGPVAAAVDERLRNQHASAHAELLEVTARPRYARLLDALVELRDNPPFTAAAGRPVATLGKAARRAEKVLRRRLKRASSRHGTDAEMHAARKAGKRARYAVEAVRRAKAVKVGQSVAAAKKLQDLLGEFQDSVVAAAAIERLSIEAHDAGEDTFTYGVLYSQQRARADAIRSRARRKS